MSTSTLHLGIFYMPQIYDMGPTALLPLRRKACWGFFSPLKNPTVWFTCCGEAKQTWHISKYITLLPLLPNKRETYFVNISTVQLVLYLGKRKLLDTCSNSKSSLQYVITWTQFCILYINLCINKIQMLCNSTYCWYSVSVKGSYISCQQSPCCNFLFYDPTVPVS